MKKHKKIDFKKKKIKNYFNFFQFKFLNFLAL